MNSKPVFALREVESDVRAAVAHYESWRPDGKMHLLGLYQETISWIEWNPDLFPRKFGRVQRAILKRSYYIVYFIQEPDRTMSTRAFISVLAAGILSLAGCLKFGDDTELLAPNVTLEHLQQVSSLTGIQFPDGSTGLAYYYLGSGIDDALALKVAIPEDKKETFLQNEVFQKGSTNAPNVQIGKPKAWWKIESLTDRTDRTLELPQARFVECTLGVEDGKLVVYISWIST